jgi:hypothetical protein
LREALEHNRPPDRGPAVEASGRNAGPEPLSDGDRCLPQSGSRCPPERGCPLALWDPKSRAHAAGRREPWLKVSGAGWTGWVNFCRRAGDALSGDQIVGTLPAWLAASCWLVRWEGRIPLPFSTRGGSSCIEGLIWRLRVSAVGRGSAAHMRPAPLGSELPVAPARRDGDSATAKSAAQFTPRTAGVQTRGVEAARRALARAAAQPRESSRVPSASRSVRSCR